MSVSSCDGEIYRNKLKYTGKSVGSFVILVVKLLHRVKYVAQSGRKHLTGDSLTYQNVLHMHISTWLNFS